MSDNQQVSNAPWADNEPNDAGDGEGCVVSRMDGTWNDIGCAKTKYALCQRQGIHY